MNIFKKRSGRATLGTLTLLLISAQGAWGQAGHRECAAPVAICRQIQLLKAK
jgi:hypothetical protein